MAVTVIIFDFQPLISRRPTVELELNIVRSFCCFDVEFRISTKRPVILFSSASTGRTHKYENLLRALYELYKQGELSCKYWLLFRAETLIIVYSCVRAPGVKTKGEQNKSIVEKFLTLDAGSNPCFPRETANRVTILRSKLLKGPSYVSVEKLTVGYAREISTPRWQEYVLAMSTSR